MLCTHAMTGPTTHRKHPALRETEEKQQGLTVLDWKQYTWPAPSAWSRPVTHHWASPEPHTLSPVLGLVFPQPDSLDTVKPFEQEGVERAHAKQNILHSTSCDHSQSREQSARCCSEPRQSWDF